MNAALTRPNLIARAVGLAALAGVVITLILILQGGPTYTLKIDMTNANGIRPGSEVLLGGVTVGTVSSVELGPHSIVVVTMHINPKLVKIGRGATAAIVAANLLGEEYVALHPGNPNQPLPTGSTLSSSAVTVPTDLDQIIDVLDPDTQRALATLINEAGIAVAGRSGRVSSILRQIPVSVPLATRLLTQLVSDNHTLTDLVASGTQFITSVNQRRSDVKRIVDAASGAATTAALRAGALRRSLVEAPQALETIQRALVSAGATTRELTQPAGELADTAAPLDQVLGDVKPFERAAVPALNRAASVAPLLTRLGEQATPTVKLGVPTLTAVDKIAKIAQPLTYRLGANIGTGPGIDGLLGVVQGWAQAIQFRDGLGHEFQGDINFDPSLVIKLANMGTSSPAARRANGRVLKRILHHGAPTVSPPTAAGSGGNPPKSSPVAQLPGHLLQGVGAAVGQLGSTLGHLTSGVQGAVSALTGHPTNSTPSDPAKGLAGLLNYLVGK